METKRYRLIEGSHTTGGVRYFSGRGDASIIELTESQATNIGANRLELVSDVAPEEKVSAATTASTNTGANENEVAALAILSKSIPDIKGEINTITDLADLELLRLTEQKGQGREGVFKALNARKQWLESEH